MKNAVIGALIAAIAIGGALGAFAATRTVETTANVDVRVWQRASDGELFISTRPEGSGAAGWATSAALDMSERHSSGRYYLSPLVTVAVPVEVEVPDVERATPTPSPIPAPARGTCCEVQGMEDDADTRDAVLALVKEVIEFADDEYGFSHSGGITINISHSVGGLFVHYEEAFGERPATLPDTCSFQEGEHLFFGPRCRADRRVIAAEWFTRAVGVPEVEPLWLSEYAYSFFTSSFHGRQPLSVREHRFRSAIFFERPTDLRRGRASEDMRELAFVYLVQEYGEFSDWVGFHRHVEAGWQVKGAFEAAFDVTLPEFYSIFEEWADHQKIVLIASSYGSCKEAILTISGYKGGFPDYRVPLEPDHDDDGIVCEGTASN